LRRRGSEDPAIVSFAVQSVLASWSYHNEGVVQDEHDSREPKGPALAPEDHLAEIADIANLRMAQTEFPADERGV
jgi:hypothetical protein